MSAARTILVGGVSSLHDELLAAALRGRGVPAEAVAHPDARALAAGRALLARGHCNPTYFLAGALVEHLRRLGPPAEVAGRIAYLTAGSCGPCRFATYAAEHRRAVAAAGYGDVPVVAIDQLAPRPTEALAAVGVRLDARLLRALAVAVVAADVLARAGCQARPRAADPAAADAAVAAARHAIARALERGASPSPALAALHAAMRELAPASPPRRRVRVRITGEFFAATTDGDGGYRLVRWLEGRGAAVVPPAVTDWLAYLAWQTRRDVGRRLALPRPDPAPHGLEGRDGAALVRRAAGVERGLEALYRRYAAAAGVEAPLLDLDDVAALAVPHYLPDLRAGMGHLEVGTFLAVDRDRSADLVVTVKPFGCLPSSAVSDGILANLSRSARVGLAVVETTGDAEAAVESRLELALEQAAFS